MACLPFIVQNVFKHREYIGKILIINSIILCGLFLYSIIFKGNDILLGFRFFLIINLILISFFIPRNKNFINIMLSIMLLHSLVLIVFELYLMFFVSIEDARSIRANAILHGTGDIYTYNGFFYKIQIKGNELLPFAFFVSVFYLKRRLLKWIISSVFLFSILIAGNFAFLLAILFFLFIFYIVKMLKSYKKIALSIFVLSAISISLIYLSQNYLDTTFNRKSEYSFPARSDQVHILLEDMSSKPLDLILGKGFGNIVNKQTTYRDYSKFHYYEIQSLYVFNQMGVLYFTLYVLTICIFIFYFWKSRIILGIFLSYLTYAITNPYIFDVTNIIVLVVLGSLSKLRIEEKMKNVETKF